jgi:hypothetical protein
MRYRELSRMEIVEVICRWQVREPVKKYVRADAKEPDPGPRANPADLATAARPG